MQRLFSMFPTGLPGVALFFLRLSVIGMLFDSTIQNTTSSGAGPCQVASLIRQGLLDDWSLGLPALALTSLLLLCGAFTPIASLLSIILQAINWPLWDWLRSLEFSLQALVMIALFFLGPGAYSIDSKMFGRRIILPPK